MAPDYPLTSPLMATIPKNDSDSDSNDSDYIPLPNNADEELSSPSDDEQQQQEPKSKHARAESPKLSAEEDKARKKALWESFQASVGELTSPSTKNGEEGGEPTTTLFSSPPLKLVKIQKRYRFAGEEITEVVEVPEDSPDVKKWPRWHSPSEETPATTSSSSPSPAPTSTSTPSSVVVVKKRPGPRKPKTQLAGLSLSSNTKLKKLTTLDKSMMDWKAHVQSPENAALQDELEANRRGGRGGAGAGAETGAGAGGGGYLDRVDFLRRVEERKEAVLEAARGSKRRRM